MKALKNLGDEKDATPSDPLAKGQQEEKDNGDGGTDSCEKYGRGTLEYKQCEDRDFRQALLYLQRIIKGTDPCGGKTKGTQDYSDCQKSLHDLLFPRN
jgi:hypothetical protein